MSSRQVRDEVMTIVLAGHETTTVGLTWAWYLLAQHPDVEAALLAEIDRVLGDRLPGVGDPPSLVFTGQVVLEVLRLYPPIWALAREADQAMEIGGVLLRRGDVALCSQWAMHRDARYFARPEVFEPGPELKLKDGGKFKDEVFAKAKGSLKKALEKARDDLVWNAEKKNYASDYPKAVKDLRKEVKDLRALYAAAEAAKNQAEQACGMDGRPSLPSAPVFFCP